MWYRVQDFVNVLILWRQNILSLLYGKMDISHKLGVHTFDKWPQSYVNRTLSDSDLSEGCHKWPNGTCWGKRRSSFEWFEKRISMKNWHISQHQISWLDNMCGCVGCFCQSELLFYGHCPAIVQYLITLYLAYFNASNLFFFCLWHPFVPLACRDLITSPILHFDQFLMIEAILLDH